MVHGPLVMDQPQFSSRKKRTKYLEKVVSYSRYADVVGFDVYPVPKIVAKLATPLSDGKQVSAQTAVEGYLQWMSKTLPGKSKLMVLQGFAYSDMYETGFLRSAIPLALRKIVRPPSDSELETMLAAAKKHGVKAIVFWGQAALRDTSQAPWPAILRLSKKFAR